jgi:protein tyrosine/serine phosphatase
MNILKWIVARCVSNLGKVEGYPIFRSAQGLMLYLILPFLNIDVMLNVANDPNKDWHDKFEKWLCKILGIEYIEEFRTIKPYDGSFDAAYNILCDRVDAQKKRVLVHCEGGKDRTGGLIAMYMIHHGFTLKEAMDCWSVHKSPNDEWVEFLSDEYFSTNFFESRYSVSNSVSYK